MVGLRSFGVDGEFELLFPVEGEAGSGEFVVSVAGAGAVSCDVGGVGGDFVGDQALLDILLIREAQVFLGVT